MQGFVEVVCHTYRQEFVFPANKNLSYGMGEKFITKALYLKLCLYSAKVLV